MTESVAETPVGRPGPLVEVAPVPAGAMAAPPAADKPPTTAHAEPPKSSRLAQLTGLRGVGALTVVISHCLNTTPSLVHPASGTLGWWVSYTPINLLWDGDEAVLMFFVLSGFVLARPLVTKEKRQSYFSYYPRRLLRLYPPLWGALLFTFLLTFAESRHMIPGATFWLNNHSNWHLSTLQDALLPRIGTTFDGPLWSLRWELLFSMSLPLYIVLGRAFKRWNSVKAAAVIAILLLGVADIKASSPQISDAILYMPMFGVGVVMAYYETELVKWFRNFMGKSIWIRIALIVVVIVTGDMTSEISPIKGHIPGSIVTLAHGLGVVGAALLIAMVISWPTYSRALQTRAIDWVGTRSFSLYLVHDSILVTICLALGGHPNPLLLLALVLPSCFVAIAIFYALVEGPTQQLSNNVGKRVQKWANQRSERRQVAAVGTV
jgi:peptidoglycan/LPS O-acetylase OafA/YrhL